MENCRSVDSSQRQGAVFLVEHYWPDATAGTFVSVSDRLNAAVNDMAGSGATLRLLHATFVPEEECAMCVFASTGPELVEEAYRRAGVGFERILSVVEIGPGSATPSSAGDR